MCYSYFPVVHMVHNRIYVCVCVYMCVDAINVCIWAIMLAGVCSLCLVAGLFSQASHGASCDLGHLLPPLLIFCPSAPSFICVHDLLPHTHSSKRKTTDVESHNVNPRDDYCILDLSCVQCLNSGCVDPVGEERCKCNAEAVRDWTVLGLDIIL